MNTDEITARATRAHETLDRLSRRQDLIDTDDPVFRDILAGVSIQSAIAGGDEQTARIYVTIGYIAGRLRGRKEAIMMGMLGTEESHE